MRINAYVMAADPAWIEASVSSYYALVREIVVSYDAEGLSWSGTPLPIEECLDRLGKCDPQGKMRFCPGHFARRDHDPMENDTFQRQTALDMAGRGADWVLQLDTDEVIPDPAAFIGALEEADRGGFGAMEYPARWLYQRIGERSFLERCSRFWKPIAGFPGPVAVRPGAQLRYARQCDASLFRVDFGIRNTDPCHGRNTPVHRAISTREGILHYSWIRDEAELRRKTASWGHSRDPWDKEIAHWKWAGKHPLLATMATPLMSFQRRVRPVRLPATCLSHGASPAPSISRL